MWLKKKNPSKEADAPEKLRYSRYYEHDGILRAFANRAMVLAFLCVPTTMLALVNTSDTTPSPSRRRLMRQARSTPSAGKAAATHRPVSSLTPSLVSTW